MSVSMKGVVASIQSLSAAIKELERVARGAEEEIYALKQRIDRLEIDSSEYDMRLDDLEIL